MNNNSLNIQRIIIHTINLSFLKGFRERFVTLPSPLRWATVTFPYRNKKA
jgi:hypothetical protein